MFDEKLSASFGRVGPVAHMAIVVVGTSVADERTFFIMKFVTVQMAY